MLWAMGRTTSLARLRRRNEGFTRGRLSPSVRSGLRGLTKTSGRSSKCLRGRRHEDTRGSPSPRWSTLTKRGALTLSWCSDSAGGQGGDREWQSQAQARTPSLRKKYCGRSGAHVKGGLQILSALVKVTFPISPKFPKFSDTSLKLLEPKPAQ